MKRLLAVSIFMFAYSTPSSACSMVACIDRGVEMRSNFEVDVKHRGKPLRGVAVRVTGTSDTAAQVDVSIATDADGRARINERAPCDYWLKAEFLGQGVAYHCFYVARRPSFRAKRSEQDTWGDDAPSTSRLAGRLLDSHPGTGGTPLMNLIHRVEVPIGGAAVTLQNAITGQVLTTTSDSQGGFAFDSAPNGTYVLLVKGGDGRAYDPSFVTVRLNAAAAERPLLLKWRESGCGGASLTLQ